MPKYEDFKSYLQAHGEWNAPGVDIVWCGDAFIVHTLDPYTTRWEPRFASKSVRKVYTFVAKQMGE